MGTKKEIQLLLRICSKEWGCHGDAGKTSVGNFICYGESTEKRKLAPKGGVGNTTYDKVFDAIWDNTIGKL